MNQNKQSFYTTILIVSTGLALVLIQKFGLIGTGTSAAITENEIMEHIKYLSHEDRQGRYPGTKESKDVISYMVRQLKSYGVKPGLENKSYVQPFNITDGIELGENNSFIINQDSLTVKSDFIPVWFSGNASVTASVVFAGYGFNIDEDQLSWQDYDGLDVSGKWVMVMRNSPDRNNQHSAYGPHSGLHKKMLVARDKGAAGILFISQVEDDELYPLKYISGYKNAGIPAIHLSNDIADNLLNQLFYLIYLWSLIMFQTLYLYYK